MTRCFAKPTAVSDCFANRRSMANLSPGSVDNSGDDASVYRQRGAQVLEFQCLLQIYAEEATDYIDHFFVRYHWLTPGNCLCELWAKFARRLIEVTTLVVLMILYLQDDCRIGRS
jgi:hypothetical protein